ncbi:uncharacterized protein LOC108739357 [Agrilus planipennis]|uniref:Uncharacterized protein LOC108739357 n=1 Tax=Agrilus planipennis TaxID=224129 RepID=A0A1W4X8N6_AGRPL|nr:uncharacterized protein LOC108739357 [Agrilus planipennis]
MATPMNARESERHLTCPYNPCHQILSGRMATHLVKCKRNYPDAKIVECKYNNTHRIPEPELKYHHDHCKDRVTLDKYMYVPETNNQDKYPVPKYDLSTDGECWDDVNVPTYNPEEHIKDKPILRNIMVQSAAVKRDFRNNERQRHQKLSNMNKCSEEKSAENFDTGRARRPAALPVAARKAAKDVSEDDPVIVASLMEKVKLGAESGPRLPNYSLNQKSKLTTENLNAVAGNSSQARNGDFCVKTDVSSSFTDSGHGPWTAADIAKKAVKPRSVGRGRSIAKDK